MDWLTAYHPKVNIQYTPFDHRSKMEELDRQMLPIVFSPGPNRPENVIPSLNLLKKTIGTRPILGVCLGHQIIGSVFGAKIQKSTNPFHGTSKEVWFDKNSEIFCSSKNASQIKMATYNSLVISKENFPTGLSIEAKCEDNEIQAISVNHLSYEAPCWGVQFHPESFLSEGCQFLRNSFFHRVEEYYQGVSNSSFRKVIGQ